MDDLIEMQDEIDQLDATAHYFKLQLEAAKAEIERLRGSSIEILRINHSLRAEVERLRGALEKITGMPNDVECREIARTALGDQVVDTNKVMGDGE